MSSRRPKATIQPPADEGPSKAKLKAKKNMEPTGELHIFIATPALGTADIRLRHSFLCLSPMKTTDSINELTIRTLPRARERARRIVWLIRSYPFPPTARQTQPSPP